MPPIASLSLAPCRWRSSAHWASLQPLGLDSTCSWDVVWRSCVMLKLCWHLQEYIALHCCLDSCLEVRLVFVFFLFVFVLLTSLKGTVYMYFYPCVRVNGMERKWTACNVITAISENAISCNVKRVCLHAFVKLHGQRLHVYYVLVLLFSYSVLLLSLINSCCCRRPRHLLGYSMYAMVLCWLNVPTDYRCASHERNI